MFMHGFLQVRIMAAPAQQQIVHQWKLSGKMDPNDPSVYIFVIDTVTKKKWEAKFAADYFNDFEFDCKGGWDLVKAAVSTNPPGWSTEYPGDVGNLPVNIQDGKWKFELSPVEYVPNDAFNNCHEDE